MQYLVKEVKIEQYLTKEITASDLHLHREKYYVKLKVAIYTHLSIFEGKRTCGHIHAS